MLDYRDAEAFGDFLMLQQMHLHVLTARSMPFLWLGWAGSGRFRQCPHTNSGCTGGLNVSKLQHQCVFTPLFWHLRLLRVLE
jgi:hypothetical protein